MGELVTLNYELKLIKKTEKGHHYQILGFPKGIKKIRIKENDLVFV